MAAVIHVMSFTVVLHVPGIHVKPKNMIPNKFCQIFGKDNKALNDNSILVHKIVTLPLQ